MASSITMTVLLSATLLLACLVSAAPTSDSNPEESPITQSPASGESSTQSDSSNNTIMATLKDSMPIINRTSSFTCFGREMGYYADVERDCRIYFFCMAGNYNGELVYQRISYLCLHDDVFDQQALDCVAPTKSTTKCHKSSHYFSTSNEVLRSAIASSHYENSHSNNATSPGAASPGAASNDATSPGAASHDATSHDATSHDATGSSPSSDAPQANAADKIEIPAEPAKTESPATA